MIKKNDFVEIEYTGTITEDGMIFDTTSETDAKKQGLYSPYQNYGPITIIAGSLQVLPGLDRFMQGKEPGSYTVLISANEAFGKKRSDLLRLIPKNVFEKQKVPAQPGMQVTIDGNRGVIKTVSGGRCVVDFNHPLAGKDLSYSLKINRIVTDPTEQVEAIVALQLPKKAFDVKVDGDKTTISIPSLIPQPLQELFQKMITQHTSIKTVTFEMKPSKKDINRSVTQ